MPVLQLTGFPAEERARVEQVLGQSRLRPHDVLLTKRILPPSHDPDDAREMITFVHGAISRTYLCSGGAKWIELLSLDLAIGQPPGRGSRGGRDPNRRTVDALEKTSADSAADGFDVAASAARAMPPSRTRLVARIEVAKDDAAVLRAIDMLEGRYRRNSRTKRAAILNGNGDVYREVDVHTPLDSVRLTAALNAAGYSLQEAPSSRSSRRYRWIYGRRLSAIPGEPDRDIDPIKEA